LRSNQLPDRTLGPSDNGIVCETDDDGVPAVHARIFFVRLVKPQELSVTFRCPNCPARPALSRERLVEILVAAIENRVSAVGIDPSGEVRPLGRDPLRL
jgi:hypothetical protein